MANTLIIEIPYKFPSLNDYTRACRSGWQAGAGMKKTVQKNIFPYIQEIKPFEKPIEIHFLWIEDTQRRDFDNIAFAKKFILDALQECKKLKNDNRKWVKHFSDDFEYGKVAKVVLFITEMEDTLAGKKVITNKDEGLKNIALNHFSQMEDINLMGKFNVVDHASIYEWIFDSVYDAIIAANYLANHFEFCQRK